MYEALRVLEGVEGIGFCHFENKDVVRHSLVQRIVQAYESHTRAAEQAGPMGMDGEAGAGSGLGLAGRNEAGASRVKTQ